LAICKEVGMQFAGPMAIGALSRAVEDATERAELLAMGEQVLKRGSVGHSHLWFYRDAIEASLAAGEAAAALRYAAALEDYTRAEPLPWADLFIARGRALAATLGGPADDALRAELARIADALRSAGLTPFLPPVEAVLSRQGASS
jgi:hypothetical protein